MLVNSRIFRAEIKTALKSTNRIFSQRLVNAPKFYTQSKPNDAPNHDGSADSDRGETKKKASGIKALMAKYGYTALGVYIALTLIDLPLSFLAVHSIGLERTTLYLNRLKRLVGYGEPDETVLLERVREKERENEVDASQNARWLNKELATELLLAYGIHKALIVVRLPLTAAILPATVRTLTRFGWAPRPMKTFAQGAPMRARGSTMGANSASPSRPLQLGDKATRKHKWFDFFM